MTKKSFLLFVAAVSLTFSSIAQHPGHEACFVQENLRGEQVHCLRPSGSQAFTVLNARLPTKEREGFLDNGALCLKDLDGAAAGCGRGLSRFHSDPQGATGEAIFDALAIGGAPLIEGMQGVAIVEIRVIP